MVQGLVLLMTRRVFRLCAALCLVALAACNPWRTVEPTPISEDARLGTRIFEVDEPRPVFISTFFYDHGIYVSAYLGEGYDVESLAYDPTERIAVYRLDPESLEVTPIPDPPFTPGRRQYFSRVLSGDGVLMIAGEEDQDVAYFDGSSWSSRTNHPDYVSTSGRLAAWGPDRLYYQRYDGGGTWIDDGSGWRPIGPDRAEEPVAHAVAFSDTEIAFVLHRSSSELCSQRFATPSGTPMGDPVCWETPARVADVIVNLNGTIARHRVFVQHEGIASTQYQIITISDGTFEEGAIVDRPSLVAASPESPQLLFRSRDTGNPVEIPEHLTTDGAAPETAFGPFTMRTECGCNRNEDATCDCVVREPIVAITSVAPDVSRAAFTWLDQLDGRRRAYVRVLDLPYEDNPYRFEMPIDVDAGPPRCELMCDPWETCLFDTNGRQLCWPRDDVPDGGVVVVPPEDAGVDAPMDAGPELGARIAPDVTLTDGTQATMDIEGVGDPAPAFALAGDGTQGFECEPFATYRLSFSGDGHVTATFEVTAGAFGSLTPAGPHVLPRGIVLGAAPASPMMDGGRRPYLGIVVHPDGDLMVVADGDDRWLLVRANAGGEPTVTPVAGVTARNLTGFLSSSAAFTPDGALALLDTTDGLAAVDVDTGAVVGTLSGGPFDLSQIAFAGESATFVVRDTVTDMLRRIGTAVVASWTSSSLTELRRITEPGLHETLRADGSEVARAEPSGSAVIVDVATGARESIGTIGQHGFAAVSPSGRYLLMVNRRRTDTELRPLCWEDFEKCQVRVWDRASPSVRTLSTSGGRFWMSSTDDVIAFEDGTDVRVEDLAATTGSSIAVPGLVLGRGRGFRDTFTVTGDAGAQVIRLSTASSVLSVPGVGRAFERTLHQHPDGTILVGPSTGCSASCEAVRIDPSAPAFASLPGSFGKGNVAMGSYQVLSTNAPVSVATPDASTIVALATGGDGITGSAYFGIASHGAPCVAYVRTESWNPGTRTLYCGP
jgi:hypothetical protein